MPSISTVNINAPAIFSRTANKSIVCEEEPYFLELIRYIHLNPLRAGLVKDLEELDQYPWSGHSVLLGNRIMAGQETDEVLARFGNGHNRSLPGYRQFIADGIAAGRRTDLVGGGLKRSLLDREESREYEAYDERILGSGEFVETLTGVADKGWPRRTPPTLGELLQRVCEVLEVDAEKVRRISKERALAKASAIFCFLAVRDYGYTGKEAGMTTGLGSAGVSIAVRRGEELIKIDPSIRERVVRN